MIMGIFLRLLSEASSLTTNILWWYRPFMPHLLFQGIRLYICALSSVFLIDLFWRSMFFRLKGVPTCFNHVYM
jgi:hypothetical protein